MKAGSRRPRQEMIAIVGILVVFGAVIGGYLMGHGNLRVLLQPNELVIIGGAAVGTLLIANPLAIVKGILHGMIGVFGASRFSKDFYLETDVEEPDKSPVFTKYPKFLKDHHAVAFLCDTLRMAITGGVGHFELDQMMETDLEVHHHEADEPMHALTTMADALPGLGIVAAVLGVVITMGSLGGPPEQIGEHVAAALVGTFLGILMCYGLFGPLASNMAKGNQENSQYLNFLRTGVISFVKGSAPILAIEFARRSVPSHIRPSFKEMEAAIRGGGSGGSAPGGGAPA